MRKLALAFSILLVAAVSPIAGQVRECGQWRLDRSDPHKMHWPQLPPGPAVSLGRVTLADDFLCTETGPIRDIHIWCSFLNDVRPKGGPESLRFELTVYADVPAAEDHWSRPGVRKWRRVFEPGEYIATTGPVSTIWYDPESDDLRLDHSDEFSTQYTFCIEEDPFIQEEGTVYWLAVKDLSANPKEYTLGWVGTELPYHWNDRAVYRLNEDEPADWTEMSWPQGLTDESEPLDLAFVISNGETSAKRDFGDAPDSSNSFPGVMMTAYEGVQANFPTVYRAGSPPYGPMHLHPRERFFLGRHVSLENEADIGYDEDLGPDADLPHNNLLPLLDVADAEKNYWTRQGVRWFDSDDGLFPEEEWLPISLVFPACERTRLDYRVTVTDPNATSAYVNVWCDWNRDGDWSDTVECPDGASVSEWAVQNDTPVFGGAGEYVFTSSSFKCWHPEGRELDPIWVRITLAEQRWTPPTSAASSGGAGPVGGYRYGETEDYLILPVARSPQFDWGDAPDSLSTPGYPVLEAHNGARHLIGGPWLGSDSDPGSSDEDTWGAGDDTWGANDSPDAEEEGQPDTDARGDDNNAEDDEDGVLIPPMTAGLSTSAMIKVSGGGGVVQWWIDFNGDKKWQSGEMVFDDFCPDGVHAIPIGVPSTAVVGKTFARVRISTRGALSPDGVAGDGEVEDHEVQIVAPAPTILPAAATQCPAVATTCPAVLTECPPSETLCPPLETTCPPVQTECPRVMSTCIYALTLCPPAETRCPVEETKCPPAETQCPAVLTKCPPTLTQCQTVTTQCPALKTYCPPTTTKCPAVETTCPAIETACPMKQTVCPTINTKCPATQTQCPAVATQCPALLTLCPRTATKCPICSLTGSEPQLPGKLDDDLETRCPAIETDCPSLTTYLATTGTQ